MVYLLYKTSSLKDENPHKLVKDCYPPRHFRRWGGLYAHTRKKKDCYPHGICAAGGGALAPAQGKKRNISLKNRREENKINHNKQRNLGVILLRNSKREYYQNLSVENICDKFLESS